MHKIDHIALAVKSFTTSIPLFEKLLNTPCYKTETVDAEGVNTAFFKTGDTKIELLESIDQEGVIARFIGKKGEGMHHIALLVEDIYSEIDRLKEAGFIFLHDVPKKGADNKLICFLHPSCTNGVLTELCQEIK
ncbi:MAG: methylmalonyl-CoA epimerase [Bacteroidota bacterium]|jgi:methylmalonyl-CoA/ethylmalonyl-CoA epimerase